MIFMCWAFAIPVALDNLVLWDMVYRKFMPRVFQYFPYFTTILIGVPLLILFYNTHVKDKK